MQGTISWDVLGGVQIEKLRDNAHTWMRRDLCLGSHGSRNVSDSCHRLSCSARLKRADVDRVSRDISVPLWFRHRFLMYQINSLGQNPIFQSLVSIVKYKIEKSMADFGDFKMSLFRFGLHFQITYFWEKTFAQHPNLHSKK